MTRLLTALLILLLLPPSDARPAEMVTLRAAVHIDTSISHGARTIRLAGIPLWTQPGETPQTIEHIAQIARQQKLDVVIVADRARATVSRGLTPFSRLFKLSISQGSVSDCGSADYLNRLRDAEAASGVLIIPGVECLPYYAWSGNPFTGLRLSHLYEHIVIVGLDTPDLIDAIPDTAAGYGWRLSWTLVFNFVFLATLILGLRSWRHRNKPRRLAARLLVALSILALIDSAPFLPRKISPYYKPTINPADLLGQYAEQNGALAFWAHPSVTPARSSEQLRAPTTILIDASPYSHLLTETAHYTGFAMFNAGIPPGEPGAEWDTALNQFCTGNRPAPVWAISECDFDADSTPDALSEAQTIIWAQDRSTPAVLDALRHGRCYATRTGFYKRLSVQRYQLLAGSTAAASGETLTTSAPSVRLALELAFLAPVSGPSRLRVIAVINGAPHPVPLSYTPEGAHAIADFALPLAQKTSYVRVLLCDNKEPVIALNPIFVSQQLDGD